MDSTSTPGAARLGRSAPRTLSSLTITAPGSRTTHQASAVPPEAAGGRTGPYIVDFACTKIRLAVETDGPSHDSRARHDAHRDRLLSSVGWRVLRIPDADVFAN